MFSKKHKNGEAQKDFVELQNTIAMLKIIALNLQTTADTMEQQVEDLKEKNTVEGK